MDIAPLTVESHPRHEDVRFLDDRLYEYEARPDSDMDLVLVCEEPNAFLADTSGGPLCYVGR